MKNERQIAIAKLITTHNIGRQEELIELLRESGYDAAQATVSRDLRQMNVVKASDGQGGLKYSLPPKASDKSSHDYASAFAASIVSIDYALNNVVVKTRTGMANAVAVGLDSQDTPEILGCVAGDDTIIIVTRTVEDAAFISENIHSMISGNPI